MTYPILLADPPWSYCVYGKSAVARKSRAAEAHYHTMPLDDIKALPVSELASKNAALFLWVTMPCLQDGIDVMAAWGFKYKTVAFSWVKINRDGTPFKGLGHYTRGNAELCLLGTRGKMQVKSHSVSQVIMTSRREHSRKPDEQYERIAELFDGPYCEIFSRQIWPGWDVAFSDDPKRFSPQMTLQAQATQQTTR